MISDNARKVMEKRYFARDDQGNVLEDEHDLFRRVAHAVANGEDREQMFESGRYDCPSDVNCAVEKLESDFLEMMEQLYFLPNTPTLVNAGRPLSQLSGCFVLPIEDDTESIFNAIKYGALVHKSGGGSGYSFSKLRPNGSIVKSTKGVASGPVSFLKVFNAATECIKQGGIRRGANMGVLRVDHPDIMEFIDCKKNDSAITNFNLSVGITDEFMVALTNHTGYNLVDPSTDAITKFVSAQEVFDKIVLNAWENGEPGIVFLDEINRHNPTPQLGQFESVNPCGEVALLPYEACNLGSINLSLMVDNGTVNFTKLEKITQLAVRFLDNVITINKFPLPEITEMVLKTRKIGLGVMGWADMLIKLEIPYVSKEALQLANNVMDFINKSALDESMKLAYEKGVCPANYGIFNYRNATRTAIAPTGTISIITDCSSGIEPLFAVVYERDQAGMKMLDINKLLVKKLKDLGIELTYKDFEKILADGTINHIDKIPLDIKHLFVTAHDVPPEQHVLMQAAFQQHTDNGVSKTINLRHDATQSDVEDIFMLAHQTHCKGITVYRDGSRANQVLTTGASYTPQPTHHEIIPRDRPTITTGFTEKLKIGCGNLYVTVNYDEHGICEIFTNNGRAGGCPSQSEAVARLTSLALRTGVDAQAIIEQLKGIRCSSTIGKGYSCTSCPDAIGRVIENVVKQVEDTYGIEKPTKTIPPTQMMGMCPNCSSLVEREGGCVICRNCGYSKCN